MSRCRWVYDKDVPDGRFLVPGCWNRAAHDDDADCHCEGGELSKVKTIISEWTLAYIRAEAVTYVRKEDAEAAQALAALREAVKPFDSVGGVLFSKNWNASDIVFDGGPMRSDCLFFEDFLNLRAALARLASSEIPKL